jgi:hypothetical protein
MFCVIQHPNISNNARTRLNRYNDETLVRDRCFLNKRSRKKSIIVLNTRTHTLYKEKGKKYAEEKKKKDSDRMRETLK